MLYPDHKSAPKGLDNFFTPQRPFGPVDARLIEDGDIATFLLNPETPFFSAMISGQSVVVGRRGAGKSAIVKALKSPTLLAKYLAEFEPQDVKDLSARVKRLDGNRVLVVEIPADYEMSEVNALMRRRPMASTEIIADLWLYRCWIHVLKELSAGHQITRHIRKELVSIIVEASKLHDTQRLPNMTANSLRRSLKSIVDPRALIAELRKEFLKKQLNVIFIVDSIDEYRIREEALADVVGGLMTLISKSDPQSSPEIFKAALPAEVFKIARHHTNPAKLDPNVEFINWKPMDLMLIATHRILLALYFNDRSRYTKLVKQFDSDVRSSRDFIHAVWGEVVGTTIVHECGDTESVISFVLRHSQLNPRHLLVFLNRFGLESRKETGSALGITPGLISDRIRQVSRVIVDEVLYGYKHVYPDLGLALDLILPRCKSRIKSGDLQSIYAKSPLRTRVPQPYTAHFDELIKSLIDSGVLGILVEDGDRYLIGEFDYNSPTDLTFHEQTEFVIHPAFSKSYFENANGEFLSKPVMPRGSTNGII